MYAYRLHTYQIHMNAVYGSWYCNSNLGLFFAVVKGLG